MWLWSYGSWIYNYLCNPCLSPLTLWGGILLWQGVLDIKLCDKFCQWLAAGQWFSPCAPVSSTNKTDCTNWKLLKVALNTIVLTPKKSYPHKRSQMYISVRKTEGAIKNGRHWQYWAQKNRPKTHKTNKKHRNTKLKRWATQIPPKKLGWTQVLVKCKQFLLLLRHLPCYIIVRPVASILRHLPCYIIVRPVASILQGELLQTSEESQCQLVMWDGLGFQINIIFICTRRETGQKKSPKVRFSTCF